MINKKSKKFKQAVDNLIDKSNDVLKGYTPRSIRSKNKKQSIKAMKKAQENIKQGYIDMREPKKPVIKMVEVTLWKVWFGKNTKHQNWFLVEGQNPISATLNAQVVFKQKYPGTTPPEITQIFTEEKIWIRR